MNAQKLLLGNALFPHPFEAVLYLCPGADHADVGARVPERIEKAPAVEPVSVGEDAVVGSHDIRIVFVQKLIILSHQARRLRKPLHVVLVFPGVQHRNLHVLQNCKVIERLSDVSCSEENQMGLYSDVLRKIGLRERIIAVLADQFVITIDCFGTGLQIRPSPDTAMGQGFQEPCVVFTHSRTPLQMPS